MDTITLPYKTQAYIAHNADSITLSTIRYPCLSPTDILVRILAASICQTDIKACTGKFHLSTPLILGHEASGRVIATGAAVTYVSPGDAVVLSYASCGECRRCISGKAAYCDELMGLNFSGREVDVLDGEGEGKVQGGFFGQSSLARVARCHERCAVRVEGMGLSEEQLRRVASLGCGIQTGAGAIWNVAKPSAGARIAVWGAGAGGLSAILAAKHLSPNCLILIDNSKTKLDMIPKEILEGVHVINSTGHEAGQTAREIKALTEDGKGVDIALDCVGNGAVIGEAHASLDKLGTIINVGSSADAKPEFTIASHLVKGVTMRGTHQGDSVPRVMVPYLINLWLKGKFPFDKLQTQYRFDDFHTAKDDMHAGKVIKPLLIL